jgi:hypothetical protein
VLKSAQIKKWTKYTKRPATSKLVYNAWRRLNEYPSNNNLSKIVKLLINTDASPKTKIIVPRFSKAYYVNVFKLCIHTKFEASF